MDSVRIIEDSNNLYSKPGKLVFNYEDDDDDDDGGDTTKKCTTDILTERKGRR
jgi:hypothetical protein